jgi:Tfp pilus assembly protein PilF
MLRLSEEQWKENPEDIRAALLHAKALASAKSFDKAEAMLNKLLEKRAGNQQILETLFMIKLQQEDAAAALAVLEQIKPQTGQEEQYLFMKGRLQFQNKQFDAAISSLQASYDKLPQPNTALLLAEVLTTAKKKDQALVLLKNHIAKYPGNSQVTTVYANLVSETQPQEAARIYQEYLQSGKKNLMILNNYAWILFQDGKFEDAKKYAEQAVEVDGRNPDALDTLGSILLAKGEIDASIQKFEKSLSLRPEFAEVQLHLAAALIKANRKVDAKNLLETVKTTESRLQKEMANLKSQL